VERTAPKSYLTVLQDGRVWKCHVDHLIRRQASPLQTKPNDMETTNKVINLSVTAAINNDTSPPLLPLLNHDLSTITGDEQSPSDNIEGNNESSTVFESTESNVATDSELSSPMKLLLMELGINCLCHQCNSFSTIIMHNQTSRSSH